MRPAGVPSVLLVGSAVLVLTLIGFTLQSSHVGLLTWLFTLSVWTSTACLIWLNVGKHKHSVFGHANHVTLFRSGITALLSGFIPIATELSASAWFWGIAITATLTLCLDGLDGYLARKSGLSSDFGARFDMETDAFLALVITLFLWQSGKVGVWILGLGIMRYLFIGASIYLPALRAELYPSLRRKTICVIQVGALCLMLCPWLSSLQASIVGVIALACLMYSFGVDIRWLLCLQANKASQLSTET